MPEGETNLKEQKILERMEEIRERILNMTGDDNIDLTVYDKNCILQLDSYSLQVIAIEAKEHIELVKENPSQTKPNTIYDIYTNGSNMVHLGTVDSEGIFHIDPYVEKTIPQLNDDYGFLKADGKKLDLRKGKNDKGRTEEKIKEGLEPEHEKEHDTVGMDEGQARRPAPTGSS